MKLHLSNQRSQALTFVDVLIVIACVVVLMALLFPLLLASANRRSSKINCVTCLKQVALAALIWKADNNDLYPMQVSVTNGGAMELIATNNVAGLFQVMSNVLVTTRILICPSDRQVIYPTNGFGTGFCNKNISYFVCLDASQTYPQMILAGDDNLAVDGVPVKSGILEITNPDSISWTQARHVELGNIAFADGSVAQESNLGLQTALKYATNGTPITITRLAIP